MIKTRITVITLFLINSLIFAGAPIQFGKIDIADLEMTQYELDTSAHAVYLCKYGY